MKINARFSHTGWMYPSSHKGHDAVLLCHCDVTLLISQIFTSLRIYVFKSPRISGANRMCISEEKMLVISSSIVTYHDTLASSRRHIARASHHWVVTLSHRYVVVSLHRHTIQWSCLSKLLIRFRPSIDRILPKKGENEKWFVFYRKEEIIKI